MTETYLQSALKQFAYYKQLGEQTIAQLTDEQLFWQYNDESNSIAIIVQHLWGNMFPLDGLHDDRRRERMATTGYRV